jgi:O-antigen/teichoic acid export membrane protein
MLVFGADWQDAGKIASIMAPALFLYFIIGPTERASFLALNLQHKALLFSIIDLIGKSTAMITGYFIGDFFMCILLMTVAQATTTVLIAFTILNQSKKTDARLNEHHN